MDVLETSSHFVVSFLGPPRVLHDGHTVPLRRRALTVAAMALLGTGPVSRGTVAARLWPDADRPATNLRPILSELRQHADGLVDIGRSTVAPGAVEHRVDVHVLEAAVDASGLLSPALLDSVAEIVAGPGGELLEGLDEPGNPELAEWLDAERQRTDHLLRRARQVVLDDHLRSGNVEAALGVARLQAASAPYDDALHAQLVDLLLRSGRRSSAIAHARSYAERLEGDLGVPAATSMTVLVPDRTRADRWSDPLVDAVPAPAGRLVGRAADLDELHALVQRARVVTVTGPGGVGKTRLVAEAARELAGGEDRILFINLEDAATGGVADILAARLRLSLQPGAVMVQVADYLAAVDAVVVLDGCEHVRDGVAELIERTLRGGRVTRFVVTSRHRLGVLGEVVHPVGPLPVTGPHHARDLFFETASSLGADLMRDASTTAAVDALCHRIDGLPLAIELTATLLRQRPLSELAGILDGPLSNGVAADPEVGLRLAGAVDSSVRLLSPRARDLFISLGAMTGSFDVAAAAAVSQQPEHDVAGMLEELADHSLLVPADRSRPGRHRLLRLARAHARQLAGEDLEHISARHAHHYWSRCAGLDLFDLRDHAHTVHVEADMANHTAAFEHLTAEGRWRKAADIAIGCYGVFATHGWTARGRSWLERCLDHEDALDVDTAQRARNFLLQLCLVLDDVAGIEAYGAALEEALDLRIRAEATGTRAVPLLRTRPDEAALLVDASIRAAEAAQVPGAMVWPRAYRAFQRMYQGRLEEAIELFDVSVSEAVQLRHTSHVWILEDAAASCALMLGWADAVIDRLDVATRPPSFWDARALLVGLAHLQRGDLEAGYADVTAFAEPTNRRRLPRSANDAMVGLAHLAAARGDREHALHLLGTTGPGRMPATIGLGRRLAADLDGTERVTELRRALEDQGLLYASADAALAREWRRARADAARLSGRETGSVLA